MPYERDNITKLSPYTPGEQPQGLDVIKLNTNENPYPPTDEVMQAIYSVTPELLRRYPPVLAKTFREAAAEAHGVETEQIFETNGGDELLRLAVTVFCQPGQSAGESGGGIGTAEPSYSLYPVLAKIHDCEVVSIPLAEQFELPDDFAEKLNLAGCRLAFIVSPHAPSGRARSIDQLRAVAETFQGILLVDEAYVDFSDGDALDLVRNREAGGLALENVLILRSLSKGYSLAGLRFGYGIAQASLLQTLFKARDSYNCDILAQSAAAAALRSRDQASKTWQAVRTERERLTSEFQQRGFDVEPSSSNFLLVRPPAQGPKALAIYQMLKQKGILVRYFDQDRLRDRLRITIGTPEQDTRLLEAVDAICSANVESKT